MGILSESGFHNFRSYVHTIGPVTATCQDMKAGCQGEKQELSYRTDFWYGFCVNGRDGEITGIDGFRWRDMPFLKLLCGLLLFCGILAGCSDNRETPEIEKTAASGLTEDEKTVGTGVCGPAGKD